MSWDIKFDDGTGVLGVPAEGPAEALRTVAPEFKWTAGVRNFFRRSFTMIYSGTEGWAEVVEYKDEE